MDGGSTINFDLLNAEAAEHSHFLQGLWHFRWAFDLCHRLSDIYIELRRLAVEAEGIPSDVVLKDSFDLRLAFCATCQCALFQGFMSLVRGHSSEAFPSLRKAIEMCAFAIQLRQCPEDSTVWRAVSAITGEIDEVAYGRYQERFKVPKILESRRNPATQLTHLYRDYDFCSKLQHASSIGLANTFRGLPMGAVSYFDDAAGDLPFIRALKMTIIVHARIIRILTANAFIIAESQSEPLMLALEDVERELRSRLEQLWAKNPPAVA
ncbi:MAG: hypothetical protein NTZ56_17705 [Acidobacteria bacterium]|nr:hypothetical protein [Acidobacteriota bacterium]